MTAAGKANPCGQTMYRQIYYCLCCRTSFMASGELDAQMKEKYGYQVWRANCPRCGERAEVNDTYWR